MRDEAKIVTVTIPNYVLKYLQENEEWSPDGTLLLHKKMFYLKTFNNKWCPPTVGKRSNRTMVKVLMMPSSQRHQSAMVYHYDQLWFKELCTYVRARSSHRNVLCHLREYLNIYGITHDDYDFDSVWKRYQRHKKRLETSKQLRYVSSSNA